MSDRRALLGCALLLVGACKAAAPETGLRVTVTRDDGVPLPDTVTISWYDDGIHNWIATGAPQNDRTLGEFELVLNGAGDRRVDVRGFVNKQLVAEGAGHSPVEAGVVAPLTVNLSAQMLPDRDGDGVPDIIDQCPDDNTTERPPCMNAPADAGPLADATLVPDVLPADSAAPPDAAPTPDVTPPDLGPPAKLPLGASCLADNQCDSGHCPDARGGRMCAAPGMVAVGPGSFTQGCLARDTLCASDEKPSRIVTLKGFQIDQYEVTHADYQRCKAVGACAAPVGLDPLNRAMFPVGNLTWTMADAYCRWAGKRLPTEAEWEHAARGPSDWIYPWGDFAPDCTRAQYRGCGLPSPLAPGQLIGTSSYGAEDMAGNIAEWVNDWYAAGYYAGAPSSNPTGPASGTAHVYRGGAFDSMPPALRTSARASSDKGLADTGVRCASDL